MYLIKNYLVIFINYDTRNNDNLLSDNLTNFKLS